MVRSDREAIRRVAVVGAGVSGLSAAILLQRGYAVTLFEREARAGGHAWTIEADAGRGRRVGLDVGFMVLNEQRYPHFLRLLAAHGGVELGQSEMSFAFCDRSTGASYVLNLDSGSAGAEAMRGSLLLPLLGEVLRFLRAANRDLEADSVGTCTLGEYLARLACSQQLRDSYVVPLGAALWSCPPQQVLAFPARAYLRFFHNHGLLSPGSGLAWRHVRGGSVQYVNAFLRAFTGELRLGAEVLAVQRTGAGIEVATADGTEPFDAVVLATHADQALRVLQDADDVERAFLGSFRYQHNHAVLHTDASVMPERADHWGAWNVEREAGTDDERPVCVSYHLNRLQGLGDVGRDFFVTLNRRAALAERAIIARLSFEHPIFDARALAAQAAVADVSGRRGVYFCGAHLGYGFHEDGARSAVMVARALGVDA